MNNGKAMGCRGRGCWYGGGVRADELNADSAMGDLMEALPGAKRALFARYHLGGCQSCAFSDKETLAELCARSELDAEEVLAHLLDSHRHDLSMLIEPVEAHAKLQDFRLIDVRTREEHEAVKIEPSEFLTQELQQAVFAGDPAAKILLYDHSGRHVLDQVAWFRGHGLHQTFGLRGGIDAWSREVDPKIPRYRLEMDA
ncbi:MAG: rhodanese-like domain-containing protein [Verrucomicrobiota bacterium]